MQEETSSSRHPGTLPLLTMTTEIVSRIFLVILHLVTLKYVYVFLCANCKEYMYL